MSDKVLIDQQAGITDLITRAECRYLDCSDLTMQEAERLGEVLATIMRDAGFWLGDLARHCEAKWPETHHQVWPVFASPGQLARNAGVCKAYPKKEDRQHECTYAQFMQVAGKPDRQRLLQEMEGKTTDETRKKPEPEKPQGEERPRWLIAIDCNYFLHRFWHSGADVESAKGVAAWIERTVERLREKGLTDCACCFDAPNNHRKELTKDWEDKYKDKRTQKDPELVNQIHLLRELIEKAGLATVSIDGMEADDVMASYAKQFPGRVTLLTQDKDQRQCLSEKCNILLDVNWHRDDHSGDQVMEYKWLSAKAHFEETGLTPKQFVDYQTIAGDNVDGIRGCEGLGTKGASDLVKRFGTVEAVIQAAKDEFPEITAKKRKALIEFEAKLEITKQLVTLRDDLPVPNSTRLT